MMHYKGKDRHLEILLEDWAQWYESPIKGLSMPSQSAMTASIQLYTSSDKSQPKQTKSHQHQDPNYWRNIRLSNINKAIGELYYIHKNVLINYYVYGKSPQEVGYTQNSYHTYLSKARALLRKNILITAYLPYKSRKSTLKQ